MSKIRRIYFIKLILRIIVLLASVVVFFVAPEQFDIVNGWNFFKKFSVFHLLWLAWIFDMVTQLIPIKNIALGSQKIFKIKFRPVINKLLDWDKLKDYISKTNGSLARCQLEFCGLGIVHCGALHFEGVWNS